jgi:hypothetical protein
MAAQTGNFVVALTNGLVIGATLVTETDEGFVIKDPHVYQGNTRFPSFAETNATYAGEITVLKSAVTYFYEKK